MARTQYHVAYNGDVQRAMSVVESYMQREGFKLVDYCGGKVFRLGVGLATAMQFAEVKYGQDILIEGWICSGLGKATMSEMELKGFVGCIPKKKLKKRLEALVAELNSAFGG